MRSSVEIVINSDQTFLLRALISSPRSFSSLFNSFCRVGRGTIKNLEGIKKSTRSESVMVLHFTDTLV